MADGWLPLLTAAEDLATSLDRLRGFARDAGRDPGSLNIEARVQAGQGEPADWLKRARDLRTLGVTHVTVSTGRGLTPAQHIEKLRRGQEALALMADT